MQKNALLAKKDLHHTTRCGEKFSRMSHSASNVQFWMTHVRAGERVDGPSAFYSSVHVKSYICQVSGTQSAVKWATPFFFWTSHSKREGVMQAIALFLGPQSLCNVVGVGVRPTGFAAMHPPTFLSFFFNGREQMFNGRCCVGKHWHTYSLFVVESWPLPSSGILGYELVSLNSVVCILVNAEPFHAT